MRSPCETETSGYGGLFLLRKGAEGWVSSYYQVGVVADECLLFPITGGRDLPICRRASAIGGYSKTTVTAHDVTPDVTFGGPLFVWFTSNLRAWCHAGRARYDAELVGWSRSDVDGRPELVLDARAGRATATADGPCNLGAPLHYEDLKVEYRFDDAVFRFRPTDRGQRALDRLKALTSEVR